MTVKKSAQVKTQVATKEHQRFQIGGFQFSFNQFMQLKYAAIITPQEARKALHLVDDTDIEEGPTNG